MSKNSYLKTHPLQKKFAALVGKPEAIYLHAEIACLIKSRVVPYRIVVARYTKGGRPANAKPCSICERAMKEYGVVQVEHT